MFMKKARQFEKYQVEPKVLCLDLGIMSGTITGSIDPIRNMGNGFTNLNKAGKLFSTLTKA